MPTAIDHDSFLHDLQKLKQGTPVEKKEYTFNNPSAIPTIKYYYPSPLLIIEGLFVQYIESIAQELDFRIFIDAPDDIRLARRLERDRIERGYDAQDVMYRYQQHTQPVYEELVAPLRYQADLVIPNATHPERALNALVVFLKTKVIS